MPFSNFFTPSGHATLSVGSTSVSVALPTAGSPTVARVYNAGPNRVAIVIGPSTSTVTAAIGLIMSPGQTEYLATAAFISAISLGGSPQLSALHITVGT